MNQGLKIALFFLVVLFGLAVVGHVDTILDNNFNKSEVIVEKN
jgi:uncharacterized membrane protein YcjF (UPF0283 family)